MPKDEHTVLLSAPQPSHDNIRACARASVSNMAPSVGGGVDLQ
jgi:hypothetical protein